MLQATFANLWELGNGKNVEPATVSLHSGGRQAIRGRRQKAGGRRARVGWAKHDKRKIISGRATKAPSRPCDMRVQNLRT